VPWVEGGEDWRGVMHAFPHGFEDMHYAPSLFGETLKYLCNCWDACMAVVGSEALRVAQDLDKVPFRPIRTNQ
jgi:hypothetical protein